MQEDEDDMTKHLSLNISKNRPMSPIPLLSHRVFELIYVCIFVSVNANDCGVENLCEINFPFSP